MLSKNEQKKFLIFFNLFFSVSAKFAHVTLISAHESHLPQNGGWLIGFF